MKKNFLIGLVVLFTNSSFSQVDYSGTEFWFNSCDVSAPFTTDNIVRIIGDVATTGTVSVPGTGFSQDFCFNTGGAVVDVFIPPGNYGLTNSNVVQNTAVHIIADNEVMVVYFSKIGVDSDYYLVPPVSSLDQEYFVNMPKGSGFWNPAYTQITASENATTVNIYNPTAELGPFTWGVGNDVPINSTTTVVLNQGESYRIQAGQDVSTGPASNLQYSGTRITSDKPVFVSSTMSSNLPSLSTPYADQLRSDLIPTSKWGTSYYSAPFQHGQTYMLHILSVDNSNTIAIDGVTVTTLNQYESFDTIVSGNRHITSNAPINIAQCSLSKDYTMAAIGDPSQFNLIAESNFDTQFNDYLNTFGTDMDSVIYMMTVRTADISTTTINGVPVSPSLFLPITGTPYSHGVVPYAFTPATGQFVTFSSTTPMMVYKTALQREGNIGAGFEWQVSRNVGRLQNVPNPNIYDTITCTLLTTLPVELVEFSGSVKEGYNLLEWTTATEYQNDYFRLERSENGIDFEEIGLIDGAESSNTEMHYEFHDVTARNPVNYYRLSQVDFNGYTETFGVVRLEKSNERGFHLYPNPAHDRITVDFDMRGGSEVNVKIYDLFGALQSERSVSSGVKSTSFEIADLASGVYLVVVENDTMRLSERFVKK